MEAQGGKFGQNRHRQVGASAWRHVVRVLKDLQDLLFREEPVLLLRGRWACEFDSSTSRCNKIRGANPAGSCLARKLLLLTWDERTRRGKDERPSKRPRASGLLYHEVPQTARISMLNAAHQTHSLSFVSARLSRPFCRGRSTAWHVERLPLQ